MEICNYFFPLACSILNICTAFWNEVIINVSVLRCWLVLKAEVHSDY